MSLEPEDNAMEQEEMDKQYDKYVFLLQKIVNGLTYVDYKEQGGSKCYRILEMEKDHGIKIFFNDYQSPTHIIIKYFWESEE